MTVMHSLKCHANWWLGMGRGRRKAGCIEHTQARDPNQGRAQLCAPSPAAPGACRDSMPGRLTSFIEFIGVQEHSIVPGVPPGFGGLWVLLSEMEVKRHPVRCGTTLAVLHVVRRGKWPAHLVTKANDTVKGQVWVEPEAWFHLIPSFKTSLGRETHLNTKFTYFPNQKAMVTTTATFVSLKSIHIWEICQEKKQIMQTSLNYLTFCWR